MIGFLDAVRECGEVLVVHVPDRLGIFDPQDPPHRNGVVARAEQFLTRREPFLLRLHLWAGHRAGHRNAPLGGYHNPRTGRGSQPGAAECAGLAADQSDHDVKPSAAGIIVGTGKRKQGEAIAVIGVAHGVALGTVGALRLAEEASA